MSCEVDPQVQDFTIPRGATLTVRFNVKDQDGNQVDLTGGKAWLTARERYESETAVISKRNTAAGGADAEALIIVPQLGATKGRVEYYLASADTSKRAIGSSFPYDAWVQIPSGSTYQVGIGTITVGPAVTRF